MREDIGVACQANDRQTTAAGSGVGALFLCDLCHRATQIIRLDNERDLVFQVGWPYP